LAQPEDQKGIELITVFQMKSPVPESCKEINPLALGYGKIEIPYETKGVLAQHGLIFPNLQNQSYTSEKVRIAQALTYGIYGRPVDLKFSDIKNAAYNAVAESQTNHTGKPEEHEAVLQQQLAFLAEATHCFAKNIARLSKEKGEKDKKSQEYIKKIADKAAEINKIALFDPTKGEWRCCTIANKPEVDVRQLINKKQECDISNFRHCITKYGRTFARQEHVHTACFILQLPKPQTKKTNSQAKETQPDQPPQQRSTPSQETQTITNKQVYPLHHLTPALAFIAAQQYRSDDH
jgi:hypothetical protein